MMRWIDGQKYTPVELPSREMNSLFVIFNQKCNFYFGILMFKGSLLSGL